MGLAVWAQLKANSPDSTEQTEANKTGTRSS